MPEQDGFRPEEADLRHDPVAGVESSDGAVVVRLAGELDLYNAERLREALADVAAEAPDRLVVELSDVTFVDSTALGVLIEAKQRMQNRNAFLLAFAGVETRRALDISALDRHFSVHHSLDAALTASV